MKQAKRTAKPGFIRRAGAFVADNGVPYLIAADAFGGSYIHLVHLVEHARQHGAEAYLTASLIDVMCLWLAAERQRDKRLGRTRHWGVVTMPTLLLALGIMITLLGNLYGNKGWLGYTVAVAPPSIMLLVLAVLERRASHAPGTALGVPGGSPGTSSRNQTGTSSRNQAGTGHQNQDPPDAAPGPGSGSRDRQPAVSAAPAPAAAGHWLPPRTVRPAESMPALLLKIRAAMAEYEEHHGRRMTAEWIGKWLGVSKRTALGHLATIREQDEGGGLAKAASQ